MRSLTDVKGNPDVPTHRSDRIFLNSDLEFGGQACPRIRDIISDQGPIRLKEACLNSYCGHVGVQ